MLQLAQEHRDYSKPLPRIKYFYHHFDVVFHEECPVSRVRFNFLVTYPITTKMNFKRIEDGYILIGDKKSRLDFDSMFLELDQLAKGIGIRTQEILQVMALCCNQNDFVLRVVPRHYVEDSKLWIFDLSTPHIICYISHVVRDQSIVQLSGIDHNTMSSSVLEILMGMRNDATRAYVVEKCKDLAAIFKHEYTLIGDMAIYVHDQDSQMLHLTCNVATNLYISIEGASPNYRLTFDPNELPVPSQGKVSIYSIPYGEDFDASKMLKYVV